MMAFSMITSQRWIAHEGHHVPTWVTALRHELVAAFRRGSMNAERCLKTYLNQGEPEMLPFEAVVFLLARVAAEREPGGTLPIDNPELAAICDSGGDEFADLIEAGRRFFFPSLVAIG